MGRTTSEPRHSEDLPTLRLTTLRRLLSKTAPPMVFDESICVSDIEQVLALSPGSLAVLVDAANVLQGTLSAAELELVADHSVCAANVMSRRVVSLLPETDLDTAVATMLVHRTDHVLVVTASGQLLGAFSKHDLEQFRRAA
jgi:CBS domain-containing protein